MFANDLSIELETVHITDDFETHKRPNAGHTHAYVMNLSRAVSYVGAGTKNGRTTTAAGGSGSSATTAVAYRIVARKMPNTQRKNDCK